MNYLLSILALILLTSCKQVKNVNATVFQSDSTVNESLDIQLPDTTLLFLWRDMKYDASLNETVNSIFINRDYLSTITEPEKAAIGYVATFIGNECWWDGKAKNNRSNLDCKIITALGLGYQCSDEHLGFLKNWFSTDKKVLSELSNCPTIPYTATIQNTFDEIKVKTKGNSIIVEYKANAVNLREQKIWKWSESVYFKVSNGNIESIKKDKSEVKLETFEMTEMFL